MISYKYYYHTIRSPIGCKYRHGTDFQNGSWGGQHDALPKFKDILSHPFLTGVSNMNAVRTFNQKMASKLPRIRTKERR